MKKLGDSYVWVDDNMKKHVLQKWILEISTNLSISIKNKIGQITDTKSEKIYFNPMHPRFYSFKRYIDIIND